LIIETSSEFADSDVSELLFVLEPDDNSTAVFPKVTDTVRKELALAKDIVENLLTAEDIEDELWNVAEYENEIFQYMRELEVCSFLPCMPINQAITNSLPQ
jgi:hypothetical protein